MKKYVLSIVIFLIAFNAYSQSANDSSKHLNFKGVPLDGTLDQFVSKMKQGGFTHVSTNEGVAVLQGDFAGYKGCFIGVSTQKQKDFVYKISVVFPDRETWSTLSGDYFELKQLLTEKYGTPTTIVEKFDRESSSRDDRSKMNEVEFDRCKYYSVWNTEKGEIQLSIDHRSILSCYVGLNYFDKINGDTMRKKALDDL